MATWTCPGCAKPYSEDDPKAIVRHVSGCDYVDGAGQPADTFTSSSPSFTITWRPCAPTRWPG